MVNGFCLMWVFNIQIEVMCNYVINVDFLCLFIFDVVGKIIGFVILLVDFCLKFFKFYWFGFVVVFYVCWIWMFIELNFFGWLIFGKE